ncbi:MAG: 16S rRNA (guanine(527)-N(7))-methyltransferase RsmG [Bacteroidales bacterium]|nr:16S rRNA (guanine(527)-N(7))-methyltransferase RsmG [Bacteroidales bacterium]
MDAKSFLDLVKKDFPGITTSQEEQYMALDSLYRDWNSKINVISRKDMDGLYSHHVLHSLAIARYLSYNPELYSSFASSSVLDLGTGGGFPGIPLAILFPDASFTLCDSVGKKTLVASEVARALGLSNVKVVNARGESLPARFDYVVSRAVASLVDFYPWVKGKYTRGILYLKGGDVAEELSELMRRHPLRSGCVHVWPVDSWLDDGYYSGKLLIHIER